MKIKILPFFWWVAEIVSRKERQLVRSQFFSKIRHYRRQFKIFGGLKSDFEKMKNSNFWRCSRDFKIWSRDQQNFQNFEHTFLATIYNLEIFGISWTASDVGDMMLVTWWCWWHGCIGDMEVWWHGGMVTWLYWWHGAVGDIFRAKTAKSVRKISYWSPSREDLVHRGRENHIRRHVRHPTLPSLKMQTTRWLVPTRP